MKSELLDFDGYSEPAHEEAAQVISSVAKITYSMNLEANKAWNILHTLQLTYRNLMVEHQQATLHCQDTYGEGGYNQLIEYRLDGTPRSDLLDDEGSI